MEVVPAPAINVQELRTCVDQARKKNVPVWDLLFAERKFSEEAVAQAFAAWLRLPHVHLATVTVEPEALATISQELARKHTCLPLKIEGRHLVVAFGNPADYNAVQDLQFATNLTIRPVIATRTEILDGIERHYEPENQLQDFLANITDPNEVQFVPTELEVNLDDSTSRTAAEQPPVVKMCNLIIQDALKLPASDIHIEAALNAVHVRMRVDGVLREYMQIPKWLQNAVTSRLKILAKLDIAERRVPQDGRIKVQLSGKSVDLRVSTLPTHFGEKVVMRILGSSEVPTLEKLGLSPPQIGIIDNALGQPQGLILVTGPTGSGKSTALYSFLHRRKSPEVNIITVEDPIEYQLAGINQVQVNAKAGLTFASALRSILRQDPDIVLVGEIRDVETAEVAFHAAMTGHLVLSTLHTNSACATIARLLDMGVDPYLIASSITLVMAQRLARRICKNCKQTYVPEGHLLEKLRISEKDFTFYRGRGCPPCGNTGYSGRVGIYEMVRMTPRLKEMIHAKKDEAELRKVAGLAGTRFLLEDAIDKVRQGITTLEEVMRVIQLQESDIVRCPRCGSFINLEFATCPYCLYQLKHLCESCGQELNLEWKICPYCNTATDFRAPEMAPARAALAAGDGNAPAPDHAPKAAAPLELPSPDAAPPTAPPPPRPEPVYESEASAESPAQTPEEAKTKKARILIVDDDESILRILEKTLQQLPLEVDIVKACDGVAALDSMESLAADLVITDIMMPRMDGFTLCERLRSNLKTTFVPIMMLTANADEVSRTRGFMVGTDDYLSKPFYVPELTARVMRLLRRSYGL